MWNTVLPFYSPLRVNAIGLRRKLDSVFLDYPKLSCEVGTPTLGRFTSERVVPRETETHHVISNSLDLSM
jgi:hypothetical protein